VDFRHITLSESGYGLTLEENMKKVLLILVSSLSLMTLSSADARSFFGIRFGFPELGVQFGSTNVFGRNVGGRLTADFGYYNNAILVGGDILYYLTIPTPGVSFDLDFYVGGGLGVGFLTNNNGVGYNIHFVLGLEFLFTRDLSLFFEARPVGYGNFGYYYGGALGVNFRL
jgi:hypothetical protein